MKRTDYTRFTRAYAVASPQAGPVLHATVRLLKRVQKIAVVGLSSDPRRPSHAIAAGMQTLGFNIIPVRPAVQEVLGRKAYGRLTEGDVPIVLVNVFRAAKFVDAVVDDCIALGLKALWIQEGIVNEPAALRAQAAGMTAIMDRCIYRDYRRECA